ncbi:MAG: rhodanese-like domain-containing protein [Thermodesulfobacteriota bacterium]
MTGNEYPLEKMVLAYLILLAVPVGIYMSVFWNVPAMRPAQARQVLTDQRKPAVLIDVRRPGEFLQGHINGAVNRPIDDILSPSAGRSISTQYPGQTLFFICSAGFDSARAVRQVMKESAQPVFNITGGMQKWPEGTAGGSGPYFSLIRGNSPPQPFPEMPAPISVQIAACAAAFAVKPLYMLLTAVLIFYLRKSAAMAGKALRLSMIFFLAGESFCALNYLFFGEDACLIEYLHIAGMVAAFGFAFSAAFQFMDLKLMNMAEMKIRCAATNVCPACYKYADAPCRGTQVLAFISLSLMTCGAMPLLASPRLDSYNTDIFGTMYHYAHPVVFQYFEIRYAPLAAMLLFGLAFLSWRRSGFTPSLSAVLLFSIGAGMLCFSFFRLFLFAVYADALWWYIIWEEITELLFITGICVLLWISRKSLSCPPQKPVQHGS